MKTALKESHWALFTEWINGKGLHFQYYGYSKSDIKDFVSTMLTYLEPDVSHSLVMVVLDMVADYNTPEE